MGGFYFSNDTGDSISAKVSRKCTNVTQAICTFISHSVYPLSNCIMDAVNKWVWGSVSEAKKTEIPEWLFQEENSLNTTPLEHHELLDKTQSFPALPQIRLPREVDNYPKVRNALTNVVHNAEDIGSIVVRVPYLQSSGLTDCLGLNIEKWNVTIAKVAVSKNFISHTLQGHLRLAACAINAGDIYISKLVPKSVVEFTNLLSDEFKPVYIRFTSIDEDIKQNIVIGHCLGTLDVNVPFGDIKSLAFRRREDIMKLRSNEFISEKVYEEL